MNEFNESNEPELNVNLKRLLNVPPEVALKILVRYPYFTAKILCRSHPEIRAICQDRYYWSQRAVEHFEVPPEEFNAMIQGVEARGSPAQLAPIQVYLGLELAQAVEDNDVPRVAALLKEEIVEDPILLRQALLKLTRDHYFNIYTMLTNAGAPTESQIGGLIDLDPRRQFKLLIMKYNPWSPSTLAQARMCNTYPHNDLIRFLRLIDVPLPEACRLDRSAIIEHLQYRFGPGSGPPSPHGHPDMQILQALQTKSTPDLQYLYCFRDMNRVELCRLIQQRLTELNALF
jgi:hypothetical protein